MRSPRICRRALLIGHLKAKPNHMTTSGDSYPMRLRTRPFEKDALLLRCSDAEVGQDRASGVDRPSTVPLAPDQNLCHNISRQRVTPESPAGGEVSAVRLHRPKSFLAILWMRAFYPSPRFCQVSIGVWSTRSVNTAIAVLTDLGI